MATTTIIPLHIGKGRTVAKALGMSVDYVENPDKTDSGEWVTSYECDPLIADAICCKGCFRITPLLQHGSHIIRSSLRRHSRKKVDT